MFKRVLIANRGEIALRINRACKELGIGTIAIYSEPDALTRYVRKADESYLVGPGPISGYLNIYGIIELAKNAGADAIHPGYGFLSENTEFARACADAGITFIGPNPAAIKDMGLKIESRERAQKAGIPVIPGSEALTDAEDAVSFAESIGFPVMIKASAGGGGRGLRICRNADDVRRQMAISQSEARKAFGNDSIFIEKYLEQPHHIEFQIVADKHGNIVHLGERDCSIQRRHQKMIEVAPSLILDESLRQRIGEAAVAAARAVDYDSVGTVEFLVDKNRNFYFLEMNTRIQVEHTITEEITGIDLVQAMIRIATGEKLWFHQRDVQLRGFAIQCRINAEDPLNDFMPATGKITEYQSPGGYGVRLDGNAYRGYTVPPYYDSMLAKLIVRGATWEETVARAQRCLGEYLIRGIKTTIPFYRNIMKDEVFRSGDFSTAYVEERFKHLAYSKERDKVDVVCAVAAAIVAHSKL
ncbi:MAG TPA: acetyl-CoA carboxylase biotin carboxylase subunit [Dissulfurispiraceae bacterium]|nr:acetyl-CoA carboxylase biotin carboxylase subunit [Dissulfurispiraceae bacterium]